MPLTNSRQKTISVLFVKYFRLPAILLINLCITSLSYLLALGLRFDFDIKEILPSHRLFLPLSCLLFFRFSSYVYWSLHRGMWRYCSTHDLLKLGKAHLASTALFSTSIFLLRVPSFPRSAIFIEFVISLLFAGGARLAVRLLRERYYDSIQRLDYTTESREVFVLGAGDSGHLLVKNLLSHVKLPYRPVGVLDDNERFWGASVHGVPILGPISKLPNIINDYTRVSAVIVAIPSLSPKKFKSIENECKQIGLALKRLQSFEDIACLDAHIPQEKVSIERILDKEVHIAHEDEINEAISGRSVLVTGAGGSIGSELCRQIIPFKPSKLIFLENGEHNLFKIEREFHQSNSDLTKQIPVRFVIADIYDHPRLEKIFKEESPDIVFHAAAYKHVPLMEENCSQAFRTNVIGTRNLLSVALKNKTDLFVMISTDKAVNPTSVMGSSKRLAEMLMQQFSNRGMKTGVVRFGNVINSNGSVIPLFKEQILSGGPITVTHPDIERYFMSIKEAVRLVLTAGTLGKDGDIYILDMGQKMKIVDVARKMLALYGRRDMEIIYTGLRPGEKITEELTDSGEETIPTRFNKVSRVIAQSYKSGQILTWIDFIQSEINTLDDKTIGMMMRQFVLNETGRQESAESLVALSR